MSKERPGSSSEYLSQINSQAKATHQILPFKFDGDGMEYFKIWIVNTLLSIITLGVYSAWATVRNNRYFHSNTFVADSSFSYLAEPLQILKGRILALIIFFLWIILSQINLTMGGLMLLALIVALPFIFNKSMAFKMRNSAYKNIQFRFHGDYWGAFMILMIWPLVGMLSLGALYPLAILRMNQYIIQNSSYGTSRFGFEAKASDYYKIFGSALGLGIILGGILYGLIGGLGAIAAYVGAIAAYVAVLIYIVVSTTNLFFTKAVLNEHGFDAKLTHGGFAKVMAINIVLIAVTLGLYLPAAKVRMAKYVCSCIELHAHGSLDEFVAAEKESVSALGEQFGEVIDMAG